MSTDQSPAPVDQVLQEAPEEGLHRARRWGLFINIATFLIGYATAVVAGALLYMRSDLDLDETQQGLVTGVVLLGAMVAAALTGAVADKRGRRTTLGVAAVLFGVGFAVTALASSFGVVLVGRAVMGLGVGTASALVPTYLGEISPPQIRGRMLTLNQLLQTVGMLTAYVVNLVFSSSGNWQAMFWVGAVPAVVLVLGAARLPETPSWLVARGRDDDANRVVSALVGRERADEVVERYRRDVQERRRQAERKADSGPTGWRRLLAPRVRPALVVAVVLAALQQFVGINTVLYYAPTIMQQTGLNASNSIIYSVIIGAVNLLMTVVSLRLIDRWGRRPLLIVSIIGMGVSVAVLGVSFIAELGSVVLLICMLAYVMSFAVGIGPVFWVLLPEVFSADTRAEGSGAGSSVNWVANFVVSTAFLPLADAVGTGQVFLLFAVVCLLGLVFISRFVPETKDREFEQVETDLRARWSG